MQYRIRRNILGGGFKYFLFSYLYIYIDIDIYLGKVPI